MHAVDAETTLSDVELTRIVYEIGTLGFSVVGGIIGSAEVKFLKSALLAAIEDDQRRWSGLPGKSSDLVENLVLHGRPFISLLDNKKMHQVFSALLGSTAILYNYGSTFLLPNGKPGAMNIHTDSPRLIMDYPTGLIMTLALDDFTVDNGATVYLPGSQNLETVPPLETFEKYATHVTRGAGAAVFFNPRCYHRATSNTTNHIRCGVTVYAVRHFMKQRFDFPRMIALDLEQELSPKARQFLGFDARVPFEMTQYFAPNDERMYKAGQG